jgi:hypothetical protein
MIKLGYGPFKAGLSGQPFFIPRDVTFITCKIEIIDIIDQISGRRQSKLK